MIAIMMTVAALVAQAPAPDGIDALAAATEVARAEARRPYTTSVAATAAWTRLERLRTPLLESDDPRCAAWLADAAEDAITLGLAIDGCGVATIVGIPTPEQRERCTALLRNALTWTRAAERSARAAIAAGTVTPELATRLDSVELAQRIPLIRACAAVLAGWSGALPETDAPAIVESAATRLAAMRGALSGNARILADACCGLGLARIGRHAEADGVLAPLAANPTAEPVFRVLAITALAENAAANASGRRRALDALRARYSAALDDDSRLLLGDLDFRLARAAAADATSTETPGAPGPAPAWRGWLDAVAATPPARRTAVRAAALARIAQHAGSMDDPVVRVARALAASSSSDGRAAGTALLRAALADPALDAGVRTLAMLELGRAELLLGHPSEGATALLEFAQAYPSEPVSRHAIDAAVAAARGTGDSVLFARVLATAVARFPDHPDHAAWRVEQSALVLSSDTAVESRESPARRAALALDGLDRADRSGVTDPALRADLAIAAADALNDEVRADAAIEALDRARPLPGTVLPEAVRQRLLEERIRALVLATRSIEMDRTVAEATAADPNSTADAAARVLRRMSAADLGTVAAAAVDEQQIARIARLADATMHLAAPTPERDEILARAFIVARMHDSAQAAARRAIAARGERADLTLALAESLWGIGGDAALAEAFALYEQVSRAVPEQSPAWWLCQTRRLQILDRVSRSTEAIAPKVARLKAIDPALGGPAFAASMLEVAARHE